MNTWKKFASIGLAAVMAVSMAACGSNGAGGNAESGSDSGEAQKLTLILRAGAYGDSLKAALPAFEEEHNVECEVLELSFDDFSYPKGMIDNRDIGNLGKNFSLTSGKWRYKTFKPIYDFHEKFHIDTKYGTFLVVKGILRRKIKQWDKVDDGKGKGK